MSMQPITLITNKINTQICKNKLPVLLEFVMDEKFTLSLFSVIEAIIFFEGLPTKYQ